MSRREAGTRALPRTLTAALLLLGLACGGGSPAEPIAVVGATLIDGTERRPIEDAVVLVRDGRFECVGDHESCPVPLDARVIDGSDQWVVPGLIDTHVHLLWNNAWTAQAQTLRLAAGITTVREMASWNQLKAVLAAAPAAEDANYPGPRIFVSGRLASPANGDQNATDLGALATELIARGVDGLKIKSFLPRDGLAIVLEEAESHGLSVYGHAPDVAGNVDELEDAFRLGLDGVNHVVVLALLLQVQNDRREEVRDGQPAWIELWQNIDAELEERLIAAMLAEDVWLEPTLVGTYLQVYPHAYAGAPALPYLPAGMGAQLRGDTLPSGNEEAAATSLSRMGDLVRRFKARGGRVSVGSDQSELPALGFHEEIALLVEAGLTPHEALRAATSEAAIVLGWDDRLGTVEAGKIADLVLLSADPLVDVRNSREVRLVVKGGVVYDPAELEAGLSRGLP